MHNNVHANEQIHQLIYVSRAIEDLCYSDLQSIIETSLQKNKQNHITGILLYKDHYFLQLLEGSAQNVKNTLSCIIKDPRHHHLQVHVESKCNERIFPHWQMAFIDGDTAIESCASKLQKIFDLALSPSCSEKEILLRHLRCFKDSTCEFKNPIFQSAH